MDVRSWKVAVLASNPHEAQLVIDLMRHMDVWDARTISGGAVGLVELEQFPANIILTFCGAEASEKRTWVRAVRRAATCPARKAPVFMIVDALTVGVAQQCGMAGANAVIGESVSGRLVLNTIAKVLARPGPFVEGVNYVGPCRRAGIVRQVLRRGAGQLTRICIERRVAVGLQGVGAHPWVRV